MVTHFFKSCFAGLFFLSFIALTASSGFAGNDTDKTNGTNRAIPLDPSKIYWADRLAVQYAVQAGYQVIQITSACDGTNNQIMTTSCGTRILIQIGDDGSFVGMIILPN